MGDGGAIQYTDICHDFKKTSTMGKNIDNKVFCLLLTDDVAALKDMWVVGDGFLHDCFSTFQATRMEARIDKTKPPYLHDYYNVQFFMCQPLSNVKSVEARIVNLLIEGLNNKLKLPKYILIIPEKDFLAGMVPRLFDHGVKSLMKDGLEWMMKNMLRLLDTRKEDIRNKRPGALSTSAEPRLIWVTTMFRPKDVHPSVKEALKLVRKGNECLEELVKTYDRYNHILYVENIDEYKYFDNMGKLTSSGKSAYWREIDSSMRKFDRGEIELDPRGNTAVNKNDDNASPAKPKRNENVDFGIAQQKSRDNRFYGSTQSRSGKTFTTKKVNRFTKNINGGLSTNFCNTCIIFYIL